MTMKKDNDNWTQIIRPGTPYLDAHAAVFYGDSMYVFGGGNDGPTNDAWVYSNDLHQFNLTSMTWKTLQPAGRSIFRLGRMFDHFLGGKPEARCCVVAGVTSDGSNSLKFR